MPLGFLMLLAVVVLVGGMWLYNAWPEWQLRRIAHHLDIPAADLYTTDLDLLLSRVRSWVRMRYVNLYDRTNALTVQFCDTVGTVHAKRVRDQIQKVSSEDAAEQNVLQLESILWLMEQDAKNPWEHARQARQAAHQAYRFLRILWKLESVSNRISAQQHV